MEEPKPYEGLGDNSQNGVMSLESCRPGLVQLHESDLATIYSALIQVIGLLTPHSDHAMSHQHGNEGAPINPAAGDTARPFPFVPRVRRARERRFATSGPLVAGYLRFRDTDEVWDWLGSVPTRDLLRSFSRRRETNFGEREESGLLAAAMRRHT
ncbi:MAG: hypothetical protein M1825_002010 [Sarcosagium campestre]|nr:MAG: hypothetical protein M1825_002010 [Sarcosagium campestre]